MARKPGWDEWDESAQQTEEVECLVQVGESSHDGTVVMAEESIMMITTVGPMGLLIESSNRVYSYLNPWRARKCEMKLRDEESIRGQEL